MTTELGEGWWNFDLGLTYSQRTYKHAGSSRTMNPNEATTNSRVYSFNFGWGVWKGLSLSSAFTVLDVTARETETFFPPDGASGEGLKAHHKEHHFGIGDLPVLICYQFNEGSMPPRWQLRLGSGVYLPTGSSFDTEIPSNSNFVSGTVDPAINVDGSMAINAVIGIYAQGFGRLVLYENEDEFRAGSTILYGGGIRLRHFESLVFAFGLNALHKLEDTMGNAIDHDAAGLSRENSSDLSAMDMAEEGSGGHWVYFAPSLSYLVLKGALTGWSLIASAQVPLYQHLNGVQLAEDFNVSFNIGYGFELY